MDSRKTLLLDRDSRKTLMSSNIPKTNTCKWLKEMTSAMNILCGTPQITCTDNSQVEQLWNNYFANMPNKCIRKPIVQKVLKYEIDYHDIINNRLTKAMSGNKVSEK